MEAGISGGEWEAGRRGREKKKRQAMPCCLPEEKASMDRKMVNGHSGLHMASRHGWLGKMGMYKA